MLDRNLQFTKGADSAVLAMCTGGDMDGTKAQLSEYARSGLRTLAVAARTLSVAEYEAFRISFEAAALALEGREAKVEAACQSIERGLTLVGATAIEDKLQEDVPQTIAALLRMGINLWVLTGDKQETAINIGYSSNVITQSMHLLVANESSGEALRAGLAGMVKDAEADDTDNTRALVIDGATLSIALDEMPELLLAVSRWCQTVICCRMSPLQKARIVKLVKGTVSTLTLAIGDGANDVAMLQEAHVGVGIFGKEGTQAARSADYAITDFRHLKRLLAVHGRYSYIRNASIIQASFYKNTTGSLLQVMFMFANGFSGQTMSVAHPTLSRVCELPLTPAAVVLLLLLL